MAKTGKPVGGAGRGQGRKKGSTDLATREERQEFAKLARKKAGVVLDILINIAENSESDAARVSACNTILDRGFGKCPQAIDLGDGGSGTDDGTSSSFQNFVGLLNALASQKASKEKDN